MSTSQPRNEYWYEYVLLMKSATETVDGPTGGAKDQGGVEHDQ